MNEWIPCYGEVLRVAETVVLDSRNMFLLMEWVGDQLVWLLYTEGYIELLGGGQSELFLELVTPMRPHWQRHDVYPI